MIVAIVNGTLTLEPESYNLLTTRMNMFLVLDDDETGFFSCSVTRYEDVASAEAGLEDSSRCFEATGELSCINKRIFAFLEENINVLLYRYIIFF